MSDFTDRLAAARAKQAAADQAAGRTAAAEASRREKVRSQSRKAARAALPGLQEAIDALQASARAADHQPRAYLDVSGLGVDTKSHTFSKRLTVVRWTVSQFSGHQIRVPRAGAPTIERPSSAHAIPAWISLELFADEAHWWLSWHDSELGRSGVLEVDAAKVFKDATEIIVQYLARIS